MAESKKTAIYEKLIAVHVTDSTYERLQEMKERSGIPTSWFVRRLIDNALERGESLAFVASGNVEREID